VPVNQFFNNSTPKIYVPHTKLAHVRPPHLTSISSTRQIPTLNFLRDTTQNHLPPTHSNLTMYLNPGLSFSPSILHSLLSLFRLPSFIFLQFPSIVTRFSYPLPFLCTGNTKKHKLKLLTYNNKRHPLPKTLLLSTVSHQYQHARSLLSNPILLTAYSS
jgi:hypothetical protein